MVPAVVLAWIPIVLVLDRGASLGQQRLLGVGTWLLLLALLARQDVRTRLQVAVVVAFASLVEYVCAGWLGGYVYRLHDVPWFVPPGHGLVYLGALTMGRSELFARNRRWLIPATLAIAGTYALGGLRCPAGATCSARSGSCAWRFSYSGGATRWYSSGRSSWSPTS